MDIDITQPLPTSESFPMSEAAFFAVPLTHEGALRRAADRARMAYAAGLPAEKETDAYVVRLTSLEYFALDCPHGQVLRFTREGFVIFDPPTSRDLAANCVDGKVAPPCR